MTHLRRPDCPRLAVLGQLLTSATHDASVAMCRWTDGVITLSLDEVQEISLEEVCTALHLEDQLLVMIVLTLPGPMGGVMILAFDEQNARHLAASLLRQPMGTGEWSELEQSALMETGNILGCAYMNALARLINRELVPSPPYFVQDYAASVVEQALVTQAMTSNTALVCRTGFRREGEQLDWWVMFLPTTEMQQAMEMALLPVCR